MELEDQVCSLELAKRLKELGVNQDSLFCYIEGDDIEFLSLACRNEKYCIAAFTVAELGEMLPVSIKYNGQYLRLEFSKSKASFDRKVGNKATKFAFDIITEKEGFCYQTYYFDQEIGTLLAEQAENEADARAKMLIYLLENEIIKLT